MSFNKIIIVGYLGRDPELKHTPQGTAVCKFSVATSERRKNATGESEETTTWFRITVWGRQAELASEYLSKGRQVYIEGRLRLEEYTDREGNTRTSPEVNATDLQFIGQRGELNAPVGQNNSVGNDSLSAEAGIVARKEVVAKALSAQAGAGAGNYTSKAKPTRTAQKELVSIEEDEVPF